MRRNLPACLCLALLTVLCLFAPAARSQEPSLLWGRVLDPDGRPLANVQVSLGGDAQGGDFRTKTDKAGMFRLVGLPWGPNRLRFESEGHQPHTEEGVVSEPGSRLYLRVVLSPEKSSPSSNLLRRPDRRDFHKTILDSDHIRDFPSGNNLWNLIENQDLSATSSRIDVGGMFLGLPAAISSRGSASWTQTTYALNGLDITDPFATGLPLFLPDVFSLRFAELDNARQSISALSPGAHIGLLTKEPGDGLRGRLSAYYSDKIFVADNITPALVGEGLGESHGWDNLADIHFELSAPLAEDRLGLFASLTSQGLVRDPAGYGPKDATAVLTGLVSLDIKLERGRLRLLGTAQSVRNPSLGAGRGIAPETTLDSRQLSGVYQALWDRHLSSGHYLRAGLGYAGGNFQNELQETAVETCRVAILPDTFSGAAPFAGREGRTLVDAFLDGRLLTTNASGGGHLLEYGMDVKFAGSSSLVRILDDRHLRFFRDLPLEVVEYNTPQENGQASWEGRLFAQETWFLSPFLSLSAGLNISISRGWYAETGSDFLPAAGGGRGITWLNASPRLGFNLPLCKSRDSSLSLSAARYYFTLPLNYLAYGHPRALGGLVYSWSDLDQDLQFDPGEAGPLIRQEGPAYAAVDPDLKRPYADELVAALKLDLGAGWRLSLAGFLRETRNLVETLNTGVPFSSYVPVSIHENGDDLLPGTYDDLDFILYNQDPSTLGEDFYLLTNPDSDRRISRYRGLDLTLVRRHARTFDFFLSLQAIEAIGFASPGNTERQNDDGVVGALYDSPNTLVNAKGRLRFDRGYTGRVGFAWRLPAGFRLAAVVKYYDGQPFARMIVVTGFNQGPFAVMAHTRGVARYEYNLTADLRLEKSFSLGSADLRLFADGFNILNGNLALSENEWTGPTWPLRYATEVQSPRVFRFGLSYDF